MSTITDKRQVLADAQKFAAQFSGFLKAAEIIADIGSIEQHIQELNGQTEKAKADLAEVQAAHEKMVEALSSDQESRMAQANAKVDEASRNASQIVTSAQDRAGRIVAAARQDVSNIKTNAEQALAAIREQIETAKAERDGLKQSIESSKATLQALDGQVDAAKAELERITTEHNEFLARIAKPRGA